MNSINKMNTERLQQKKKSEMMFLPRPECAEHFVTTKFVKGRRKIFPPVYSSKAKKIPFKLVKNLISSQYRDKFVIVLGYQRQWHTQFLA